MAKRRGSDLVSRWDIERHVYVVAESMREKKMKVSNRHTASSLQKARALANRRVALFTINASVRALALAIDGMDLNKKI